MTGATPGVDEDRPGVENIFEYTDILTNEELLSPACPWHLAVA